MRSSTPEELGPTPSDEAEIGARRRLELTDPWLKVLKPDAVPVEYRDTRQRGLVLRVEPSGRKTLGGPCVAILATDGSRS